MGPAGSTGTGRPINMAIDGSKVLPDRRDAPANGDEFHAERGLRDALYHLGIHVARDPDRPGGRAAVLVRLPAVCRRLGRARPPGGRVPIEVAAEPDRVGARRIRRRGPVHRGLRTHLLGREQRGRERPLAILFATFPLQTALVANAYLKAERFTAQKLLGIGVGFGGVVLIFRSQLGTAGPGQVLPMLSIVLAATCAAFATVAVKRWGHDTEPISFNAAAMAVGAAGLATVSLLTREPWGIPTWPPSLGAILYLAIAGSVVTFVAWQWLLKEMPATSLSYIALIIPIVAVLLGAGLGNETFDLVDPAGAGDRLLGIFLSTSRRAATRSGAAARDAVCFPKTKVRPLPSFSGWIGSYVAVCLITPWAWMPDSWANALCPTSGWCIPTGIPLSVSTSWDSS